MKIINGILAALFLLFAIVQYNDPDPWLWIALYGFVAIVSLMAVFKQYYRWVILGGIVVCLIGMLLLLPDFINWINTGAESITGSMKAESPHIELTREFLGLAVTLLALTWHYRKGRVYW